MAKRFTDTDKWKKPFIKSLPVAYKLLWLYILDDCDHAGIWQVDMDVANLRLGGSIKKDKAIELFAYKIEEIDGGEKWFIRDFIDFQYGELKSNNRAHESVLNILNRNCIDLSIKPLTSPLQGGKYKDKDKELDKDKGASEEKKLNLPFKSQSFSEAWGKWISYKRSQWKFSFKSVDTEQISIDQLAKMCNNNEGLATASIMYTIAKTWQGIVKDPEYTAVSITSINASLNVNREIGTHDREYGGENFVKNKHL